MRWFQKPKKKSDSQLRDSQVVFTCHSIKLFKCQSHERKMITILAFYFFQFSLMFFFVKYVPITYGRDYKYPVWAEVMGWMISLSSMVSIKSSSRNHNDKLYLLIILTWYGGQLVISWIVIYVQGTTSIAAIPIEETTAIADKKIGDFT